MILGYKDLASVDNTSETSSVLSAPLLIALMLQGAWSYIAVTSSKKGPDTYITLWTAKHGMLKSYKFSTLQPMLDSQGLGDALYGPYWDWIMV